jgi:hypothetical protein
MSPVDRVLRKAPLEVWASKSIFGGRMGADCDFQSQPQRRYFVLRRNAEQTLCRTTKPERQAQVNKAKGKQVWCGEQRSLSDCSVKSPKKP